jgi:hypothetical protein
MIKAPRRRLVSGMPWWCSVAFVGFCSAFVLLGIALRSGGLVRPAVLIAIGFLIIRGIAPVVHFVDGEYLDIRHMRRRAVVPLDHVARVTQARSRSWPLYKSPAIHFTSDNTPFGATLHLNPLGMGMTFPWALKELARAVDARRKHSSHRGT